ncbi:unnamed protein product [Linum tenue]|uniref:S-protein homolog n=1 Tax=Linum tenue TaxID=586396 RepID=A0AAV0IGN8_9ROSI|nr:unnamed protein product [Linum tenue]
MLRCKPALIPTKLLVAVTLATIFIVARPTIQRTVSLRNNLSDKILIVHCQSGYTNFRARTVDVESNISWINSDDITAMFLQCRLAVEYKRLTFDADIGGHDHMEWSIRDDGVYLVTGDGNVESAPREKWELIDRRWW